MKKTLITLSLILAIAISTGCGRFIKLLVSDLAFTTTQENGQQILETTFTLSLGEVSLPGASYDLPNGLGMFSLVSADSMGDRVKLSLNLTEIFKLPSEDAKLPNGNDLPVDTTGASIVQIPISSVIGSVYLASSNGQTLVGFAFSISQLDRLGQTVGNLGLFPNFDVRGINVTAGIFSSGEEGKTGLAAFANLGDLDGQVPDDEAKPFMPVETTISKKEFREVKREMRKLKNSTQTLKLVKEYK